MMTNQHEFIDYVISQVINEEGITAKDANRLRDAMVSANVLPQEFPNHRIEVETERGLMVVHPHIFLPGYKFLRLRYEQMKKTRVTDDLKKIGPCKQEEVYSKSTLLHIRGY
jgi:hypothetical protein